MHNLKLDFKNLFSIASPRRTQNNDINIELLLEISVYLFKVHSNNNKSNQLGKTTSFKWYIVCIDNIFVQFAGQLYQLRSAFQQVQIALE
jgi:hypothetical protein